MLLPKNLSVIGNTHAHTHSHTYTHTQRETQTKGEKTQTGEMSAPLQMQERGNLANSYVMKEVLALPPFTIPVSARLSFPVLTNSLLKVNHPLPDTCSILCQYTSLLHLPIAFAFRT
jgi:hypothetical protein